MKPPSFVEYKIQSTRWFALLLIALVVVGLFFSLYALPNDPDLGWHLRSGQLILQQHRIPHLDWLSHTMQNFPWVNHEAFIDVALAWSTQHLGIGFVNFFFVFVAIVTFGVVVGKAAFDRVSIRQSMLFALLVSPIIGDFFGIRPQVFGWLLLATLMLVINHLRRTPESKIIYVVPLIILVWVNLHGSFAVGLGYLGIILFTEGLKALYYKGGGEESIYFRKDRTLPWKVWKKLVLMVLIAAAATFINPYGPDIYRELYRTLSDSQGTRAINEWLSPDFKSSIGIFLYVFIVLLLEMLYLQRSRKIDFTEFVLLLAFLFLALTSVRNIPLFVIIGLPPVLTATKPYYEKIVDDLLRRPAFLVPLATLMLCAFFQYSNFLSTFHTSLSLDATFASSYPAGAAQYLQRHPDLGKMYNEYNIGGFLTYAAPQYLDFIDGRMVHWRVKTSDKTNGRPAIGTQIFEDFQWITGVKPDWDQRLADYGVTFVIASPNSPLDYALKTSAAWERVFKDRDATIYKKVQ